MADAAPSNTPSNDHIMGVYNRAPLAFERGRGVRLYTAEGEEYLDNDVASAVKPELILRPAEEPASPVPTFQPAGRSRVTLTGAFSWPTR